MTIAEPQLVEAACGGDAAAVERLLVVCQPDLRRFARRACSTGEDAEDAVQIALWQLYREIGALRTAAAFASWLFKIIERECYRLFHARDRLQAMDQSLDNVLRQEPLPLELRKDLVAAIALLPEPYRKILILRDIDELTAPEAAEQLGISIDAEKSRLHRAREMVRERLLAGGYLASTTQQKDYAGVLQPICFHSLAARYWRRRDDCLGHPVRQRACLAGAAAFDWCRRIDAGMPDVLADGAVRDHFGPP